MTRREQALRKIRRLERQLDTASYARVSKIEREICRLQLVYSITQEEIRGPVDYTRLFPFLPASVLKLLENKGENLK